MPAEAPPVEVPQQTTLQSEIIAKTAKAVSDTGIDAALDTELQAALDRDNTKAAEKKGEPPPTPVLKQPDTPKEPKKETPPKPPALDIPKELLVEKKAPVIKDTAAADEARQKEIEENTKGMSVKAADRFRALEAKKHEAEQKAARADALEKEVADYKARLTQQADTSEIEKYKKQVEELDAIVQKSNLLEHPKFKAHYDGKIEQEVETASKLLTGEAAKEVKALLSLPETAQRNKRLNEIAGELEPLEATKFHAAIDRADRLTAEKMNELTHWRANKQRMEQMTKEEQQQTTEQRQRVYASALNAVEKKFSDPEKGVELFRKVDGNDEWNKQVDERMAHVRQLTERDLNPEDKAEMAAWAMAGSQYRNLFLAQRALVASLQQEIQALKGGEPEIGEAGAATPDEDSGGIIDVITRSAQRVGAIR